MTPATTRRHPRRRRAGFTLLELLTVIGILLLLTAIVTVGIRGVAGGVADRSTETRFEILRTMTATYAEAGVKGGGGGIGLGGEQKLPTILQGGKTVYYSTLDATAAMGTAPFANTTTLVVPLAVTNRDDLLEAKAPDRNPTRVPISIDGDGYVVEPAYARTQAVIGRLLAVPLNKSTLDALTDDAKTRSATTAASLLTYLDDTAASSPPSPPLVLDGHGRPILFVPRAGLSYALDDTATPATETLVATDGGAFWASAGPDGSFAGPGEDGVFGTDDDAVRDNVYSAPVRIKPTP